MASAVTLHRLFQVPLAKAPLAGREDGPHLEGFGYRAAAQICRTIAPATLVVHTLNRIGSQPSRRSSKGVGPSKRLMIVGGSAHLVAWRHTISGLIISWRG